MKKAFHEFREFALRGNVLDLAVAVIIGAAFSNIVSSLVSDLIMPVLSLLRPGEFSDVYITLRQGVQPGPYPSLAAATEAGAVTMNIGLFLDAVIGFILVAIALFMIIKALALSRRPQTEPAPAPPATKECPFCLSEVPIGATRCAFCTSELPAEGKAPA